MSSLWQWWCVRRYRHLANSLSENPTRVSYCMYHRQSGWVAMLAEVYGVAPARGPETFAVEAVEPKHNDPERCCRHLFLGHYSEILSSLLPLVKKRKWKRVARCHHRHHTRSIVQCCYWRHRLHLGFVILTIAPSCVCAMQVSFGEHHWCYHRALLYLMMLKRSRVPTHSLSGVLCWAWLM